MHEFVWCTGTEIERDVTLTAQMFLLIFLYQLRFIATFLLTLFVPLHHLFVFLHYFNVKRIFLSGSSDTLVLQRGNTETDWSSVPLKRSLTDTVHGSEHQQQQWAACERTRVQSVPGEFKKQFGKRCVLWTVKLKHDKLARKGFFH